MDDVILLTTFAAADLLIKLFCDELIDALKLTEKVLDVLTVHVELG